MYISRTSSLPNNKSLESDQPLRVIQIPCRYHAGSVCLNYCNENSCFKLLCQQCIEDHLQHHKKNGLAINSIKSFKKVRQLCVDKLNRLIQQLIGKMSVLKQPKNPQQILQEANLKFEAIKKVMFEIIQQQLSRFYQQLKTKVNQSLSTIKNLQQVHENLNKIIMQLKQSKGIIIEGNKQTPQTIQKVLMMNENIYIDTFSRQAAGYSQKLSYVEFDVSINQNKFRNSVNQSLKITRNQFQDSPNNSTDMGKNSRMFAPKNLTSNMNVLNTPYNRMKQKLQSKQPLTIKSDNNIKLLHFFQVGSSYLHLITINPNIKRQRMLINNFVVPSFHSSIITSQEYIFISGGTIQQDDYQVKSDKMSKYSLKAKPNQSFKRDFSTVKPRSSHSLCQYGQYIYILGGYGSQMKNGQVELQKNVEKVNIKNGLVQIQTKSKYGGANISVVINDSILKASQQGVQIYNLVSKKWTLIGVPETYNYNLGCGWSKVSKQSLIVYGGYNSNQQGVDTCQQWIISQNQIMVKNMANKLPYRQGFLNNPGVIIDGSIYVLQNTYLDESQQQSQSCIAQGERVLLRFDGNLWRQLGI